MMRSNWVDAGYPLFVILAALRELLGITLFL